MDSGSWCRWSKSTVKIKKCPRKNEFDFSTACREFGWLWRTPSTTPSLDADERPEGLLGEPPRAFQAEGPQHWGGQQEAQESDVFGFEGHGALKLVHADAHPTPQHGSDDSWFVR